MCKVYTNFTIYSGDALYETSNGKKSWFDEHAFFPYGLYPFFERGGDYATIDAGTFYFNGASDNDHLYTSFRLVLIP